MKHKIEIINEHQKEYYEDVDKNSANIFLERFGGCIRKMQNRKSIKILDIGGGSGYFSLAVREYFKDIPCEIFVVDTMRYDTWTTYSDKINFIEDSAENLDKLFQENMFDIVFAKYVFHHFVLHTYRETRRVQNKIAKLISLVLKSDGYLCIADQFYNGWLGDSSASKAIYLLTSCKIKFLADIFRKLGAESAGAGVCFLSKKMWLNLFSHQGFEIETMEMPPPRKMKWYRHLGLFLKSWNDGCMLIVKKRITTK